MQFIEFLEEVVARQDSAGDAARALLSEAKDGPPEGVPNESALISMLRHESEEESTYGGFRELWGLWEARNGKALAR